MIKGKILKPPTELFNEVETPWTKTVNLEPINDPIEQIWKFELDPSSTAKALGIAVTAIFHHSQLPWPPNVTLQKWVSDARSAKSTY